ncbi:MAG: hypothetical protein COA45_06990 [Zetaproteobacteria bacterium]|nr:MAG: hypothetical protein COA45_06990 [Zetaproteobacteria bacterium]
MSESHACHTDQVKPNNHSHGPPWVTSAHATIHCLTGCVIGEVLGLLIGVALGLTTGVTIALAFALAYFFGFMLGILPIMKREKVSAMTAFKIIWLGEAISIFVMEVVMNSVDYSIGGIQSGSVFSAIFWIGIAVAVPAGFIVTWPVNHWLLKKQLKKCH